MNFLTSARNWVAANPLITTIAILLIIGGIFFIKKNGNGGNVLVVEAGPFIQQVSASGKVTAAQRADLGFSQSGRVWRVYAKVGDYVRAGALIAEIENGDLTANVEVAQAKLASLRVGTRQEDIEISRVAVENAINDVVNDIKTAYVNSDDAIRNKVDQFINNPKGTTPQINFSVNDSQLKNDIESGRVTIETVLTSWNAANSNLSPGMDVADLVNQSKTNLRSVSVYLDKVALAVNSAGATASLSQGTLDGYKSAVATARTNITTALNNLTSAEDTFRSALSGLALKEAGSTAEDIKAQEAQVRANVAALLKTRIYAPFSGIVTRLDVKPGEIVSPNVSEISMISVGNFQVESFIPEVNVALIKKGDPAEVTLDAYGSEVVFVAEVVAIDPAETVKNGVSTYKTTLQFKVEDPRIRSGMTANVSITTLKKDNAITVPQGLLISRGGRKFILVKESKGEAEREVTTGQVSSTGRVEVLSGLHEGDKVVLPKPVSN